MPTGPRGEKRPTSSVSSMLKAMRVATGIEEEENVDGKSRVPTEPSSEDHSEDYEMAALRVAKPKKRKKQKKEKRG